jgi:hypothetical protein
MRESSHAGLARPGRAAPVPGFLSRPAAPFKPAAAAEMPVPDVAAQLRRAEVFGHRFNALLPEPEAAAAAPRAARSVPAGSGGVIQRTSFRSSTVEQRRNRRGRTTRTSERARAGLRYVPRDIDLGRHLAQEPGTYAHGRASRGREINRGRSTPLAIEVDHVPTDGSQRGGEARGSRRNRIDTMARTAMPLPRRVHRLHPTTSGGSNYDRGAMARVERSLNRGYPHVGTVEQARQRGFAASMGVHFAGYTATRHQWPRYGANVHRGMQQYAAAAVLAAHAQGRIDGAQRDELVARARGTFAPT